MQPRGMVVIFATAETLPPTDSRVDWVTMILRELVESQAGGVLLDLFKWSMFGALAGAVLAILACILFSRAGWYDLRWRFASGIRWTIFSLTVALSAILFGLAGFWSGAIGASERVLARSQLATDVFPKIADAIADGMAWVQIHANSPNLTNQTELSAKLNAFRSGEWELHVADFLQDLDNLKAAAITNAASWLEQSALNRTPQLQGGLSEKLLHQFLSGLGRSMIEQKVASQAKSWGANRVYFVIRNELQAEAARSGNPGTIAHREISEFVVREGIVPGILKPIRATARAQQWPLIVIALLILVVPPLAVRLGRRRSPKPASPPTITPPPQSAAH